MNSKGVLVVLVAASMWGCGSQYESETAPSSEGGVSSPRLRGEEYRVLDPRSAQLTEPEMDLWRAVQAELYAVDVTGCSADWLRRSGRDGDVEFYVKLKLEDGGWRVSGVPTDPKDAEADEADREYHECVDDLFTGLMVSAVDASIIGMPDTRVKVPYTIRALCRKAPEGAALFTPLPELDIGEDEAPAFDNGEGSFKPGCVRPRYGMGWCTCGYWSYGYCWCMDFGGPFCDYGGLCEMYGCY